MRVLLVANFIEAGESILTRLKALGYTVDLATERSHAEKLLSSKSHAFMILDLTAAASDGLSVLKEVRQRGWRTPALVLTARSATRARIEALDLGADDYLIKPFECDELEARVHALSRKILFGTQAKKSSYGDIVLDYHARSLSVKGAAVELTRREFALAEFLVRHPGRVISKDEIIDQLFSSRDEPPTENAVEQIVTRLRKKLASLRSDVKIRTLRGVGYNIANRSDRCSL